MPDALVLHIGTHKTGSSSIQASLANAYEELLGQGALYPRTGRNRGRPGHANLAREAIEGSDFDPTLGGTRELLDEIRQTDPETVVLSSETFTRQVLRSGGARWAMRLCERLGVTEVQVIAYVRPQWDYLESSYAYLVHRGQQQARFPEYVAEQLEQPRHDYSTLVGAWRDLFGDRLIVRPYDRKRLVGHDVVEDFWRTVDRIPERPKEATAPRNPRPGAKATEMLLLLRRMLAEQGLDRIAPVEPALARARRTLRKRLDDVPWRGLTASLLDRIYGRFEEPNRRFVEQYGEIHGHLLEKPEVPAEVRPWRIEDATPVEERLYQLVRDEAVATLLETAKVEARPALGSHTLGVRPDSSAG